MEREGEREEEEEGPARSHVEVGDEQAVVGVAREVDHLEARGVRADAGDDVGVRVEPRALGRRGAARGCSVGRGHHLLI